MSLILKWIRQKENRVQTDLICSLYILWLCTSSICVFFGLLFVVLSLIKILWENCFTLLCISEIKTTFFYWFYKTFTFNYFTQNFEGCFLLDSTFLVTIPQILISFSSEQTPLMNLPSSRTFQTTSPYIYIYIYKYLMV